MIVFDRVGEPHYFDAAAALASERNIDAVLAPAPNVRVFFAARFSKKFDAAPAPGPAAKRSGFAMLLVL
jgi:hypothetical protein